MFRNLPEEMLVQIRCAFDLFDSNGDGSLLPNDLGNVIEQVGQKLSDLDIKEMMSFLSSTENGDEISFKDFVSLIMLRMKKVESEDEFLETFKIFDKKGTGKISPNDIKSVLNEIDEPISQQELEDLMKKWDKNEDGYLDLIEFKNMMESK